MSIIEYNEKRDNLFKIKIKEVYHFDTDKYEYVMERLDYTLLNYYEKFNSTLTTEERKNIARQVLRAFKYVHSKGLLHRDISPNNILLKVYDDGVIKPRKIYGDETLSDQDKFMAILSLTNNFWTMSNMQERDCEKISGLNYYGAYYVNIYSGKADTFDETENIYIASLGIKADTNGVSTSSGNFASGSGTSAGIRPVIETSIKNIKK